MKIPFATAAYCCTAISCAQVASAQAPVAIVEEISAKAAGIEFMDYLRPGQVIHLGASERLVIGYFNSCWREIVVGGTVRIGKEDSAVTGGTVERQKVRCDTGRKGGTTKETAGSGAMVFRKAPSAAAGHPTVYALSLVVVGAGTGSLRSSVSTDAKPTSPYRSHRPMRPREGLSILATSNVVLSAGGVYRAKAGPHEITFKVDHSAEAGAHSILGRLLPLTPPP